MQKARRSKLRALATFETDTLPRRYRLLVARFALRVASRDPRVALSIVDFHNPYEEVQLRSPSTGTFPIMDPIVARTPVPFPMPGREGRVAPGDAALCASHRPRRR